MKTETLTTFAGTFLSDNVENNRRLFYAWNEYTPNKIFNKRSELIGQYMRIKIKSKVYFVTDNEAIEQFLNDTFYLLKNKFFLYDDIDATEFSEETLNKYFELIS